MCILCTSKIWEAFDSRHPRFNGLRFQVRVKETGVIIQEIVIIYIRKPLWKCGLWTHKFRRLILVTESRMGHQRGKFFGPSSESPEIVCLSSTCVRQLQSGYRRAPKNEFPRTGWSRGSSNKDAAINSSSPVWLSSNKDILLAKLKEKLMPLSLLFIRQTPRSFSRVSAFSFSLS